MTDTADHRSVADWFDRWTALVRAVDFGAARTMFEPSVVGFGTHADIVTGIDALETGQWRQIWPNISDFRFLTDRLHTDMSPDRLLAVAVLPWTSTGYDIEGRPFRRGGRATVALRRTALDAPWRGVHTHLSLNRGTPDRTFGRPTAVA
ncbi:MAG: nuclear transport factor 2 family protein [Alphaproteobacteria bacterium]|nr:nuclear transport factor 2 family protein [Alphaproteobacteria bacterium]